MTSANDFTSYCHYLAQSDVKDTYKHSRGILLLNFSLQFWKVWMGCLGMHIFTLKAAFFTSL